ncbi:MAG: hypothetical protein NT041_01675 [Candidatus Vogelbacteria bacterium]|nr:hypothetical protein [Candidatus Vogelbacteria bacterium]
MSPFEAIMLLCFGLAWPFSIYHTWKTQVNDGKSVLFLWVIFGGYLSGIIHKTYFSYDWIIWLYLINAVMVFIDIGLFYRNRCQEKET